MSHCFGSAWLISAWFNWLSGFEPSQWQHWGMVRLERSGKGQNCCCWERVDEKARETIDYKGQGSLKRPESGYLKTPEMDSSKKPEVQCQEPKMDAK